MVGQLSLAARMTRISVTGWNGQSDLQSATESYLRSVVRYRMVTWNTVLELIAIDL
jgi:hypothetical protein